MKFHTRALYWLARRSERGARRAALATRPPPVRDSVVAALGAGSVLALNVGARWGDTNAWWRIEPLVKIVGFEPDAAECDRLNTLCTDPLRERHLPLALGAERRDAELHITSDPACSSLYPPLESLSERFPDLVQIRSVDKRIVPLTPLDDWWAAEQRPEVSFVKLDTQGSELDILRGALALLADCVGCEIEVEFSPLYQRQPLFAAVDVFLRECGFVLWRLHDLAHYSERPELAEAKGRLYWANAIYLRDYRELGTSAADLRKCLILAAFLEALDDHGAAQACLERVRREWKGEPLPDPPWTAAAIAALPPGHGKA